MLRVQSGDASACRCESDHKSCFNLFVMDEDELINNAGHGDLGIWTKKLIAVSLFLEHVSDGYVMPPHHISDCSNKIVLCRKTCKNCNYVEKQEL